jgi:Trk K+ transport system NAD-binding subunit
MPHVSSAMEPHSRTRAAKRLFQPVRALLWRGLAFALVYLIGFVGLSSGVEVSERALIGAGVAARAYYALGLFVLGGLDLGTPVDGPLLGRVMLWSAYFLAPLITASALIETAVRLVSPLALRVRPLTRHVVLAGAGRLTLLYVRRLRERDTGRTIVVVEREPDRSFVGELRAAHRAVVVTGDITNDQVLKSLRLDRAHKVLLLTDDDFANLDAAARIMRLAPRLKGRIVAHVSNLGFMRETADSSVGRACEIFNGHESAARSLVRNQLLERFHATPERDLVVLAGFGRFGQTVLHQLQEHARGSFGYVVIIDIEADSKARAFEDQPGFAGDYERMVADGDLLDPDIWRRVSDVARARAQEPVVILASGNDGTNLHAALMVRKRHPAAFVIVRSFGASPFTTEVARDAGVHAFDLAELVRSAMPEAWF